MSQLNVLNASAGSGKTHRITFEFIKSILPEPKNAGRILAITFTNKAAGEMKSRIIEELSLLAHSPGKSKMENELMQSLKLSNLALQDKAREAMSFILHHYSDLAISTIDSFIQKIIRTFARDLNLAADYEVLVDNTEMTDYIIDGVIDQVNVQKEMTDVFKQIISRNIDNDKQSLNFKDSMRDIVANLGNENSVDFIAEVISYDTSELINIMKSAFSKSSAQRKLISECITAFDNIVANNALDMSSFKTHRKVSLYNEIEKIKKNPLKYKKLGSLDVLINEKGILVDTNAVIEDKMIELFDKLYSSITELHRMQILLNDFPYVAAIAEIMRIRENYKISEGILPVSDFYTLIADVLTKEPVPFIFMRAGNRYKTIMIDEFQDTSLMQWISLTSLIHNSLATGNQNWLVGDPKQSIYRWRSGEMEIMLSLPRIYGVGKTHEVLKDAEPLFQAGFAPDRLPNNYRSGKSIVEFNNDFFQYLQDNVIGKYLEKSLQNELISEAEKIEYLKVYADVEQNAVKQSGGYVEISFVGKIDTEWLHPEVEKLILRKMAQGYQLNDIAILCRNKKTGIAISNYLLNLNEPIQVISEETLQFQSSYYCRLSMNILRVLSSEEDRLAVSEFSALMLQNPDTSVREAFQEFYRHHNETKDFIRLQWPSLAASKVYWYSPSELLTLIIQSLNISEKGAYYLIFLREKVLEQERKSGCDYDSLYAWWQEKGREMSVITPTGSNAVHIMTLHKAKGLQFPVVILPDFNFNDFRNIHKTLHWYKPAAESGIPITAVHYNADSPVEDIGKLYAKELLKTMIDSINLAYVACTRPENELFIFSDISDAERKNMGDKPKPGVMLYHYLENYEGETKLPFVFDESNFKYTFGEEKPLVTQQEFDNEAVRIRDFFIAHPHAYREESNEYDSELLRESSREGRIWHELLSRYSNAEQAERLVQQYVLNGQLANENKNNAIHLLKNIVQRHPELFSENAEVLNECEIVNAEGRILRPDRVIKNNDQYVIIDFKTGVPKDGHKRQVAQYRDILLSMGLKVSRTCLLYLRPADGESEVVLV